MFQIHFLKFKCTISICYPNKSVGFLHPHKLGVKCLSGDPSIVLKREEPADKLQEVFKIRGRRSNFQRIECFDQEKISDKKISS